MNIQIWNERLKEAILIKLDKIDPTKKLKVLDVGIFPWDGFIELSAFYEGDEFEDDIASWPNYNFSNQTEGLWPEANELCRSMSESYIQDASHAVVYFKAAAEIMSNSEITQFLKTKSLSENFRIDLLDPDTDKNYMS